MKLQDAFQAMTLFWQQFKNINGQPIPAYMTGYAWVRDSAGRVTEPPFPYITYDMSLPAFRGETMITASVWDRRPAQPAFFGLGNHVAEQVADLVHASTGYQVDTGSGYIHLRRNNNFISYMDDPDDQTITRTIITLTVRGFLD